MEWTTQVPKGPGWYWVLGSKGRNYGVELLGERDFPLLARAGCMFAGPLEPPPAPAPGGPGRCDGIIDITG